MVYRILLSAHTSWSRGTYLRNLNLHFICKDSELAVRLIASFNQLTQTTWKQRSAMRLTFTTIHEQKKYHVPKVKLCVCELCSDTNELYCIINCRKETRPLLEAVGKFNVHLFTINIITLATLETILPPVCWTGATGVQGARCEKGEVIRNYCNLFRSSLHLER
jgi:hypothetical protein